jgi:hypothetical protein
MLHLLIYILPAAEVDGLQSFTQTKQVLQKRSTSEDFQWMGVSAGRPLPRSPYDHSAEKFVAKIGPQDANIS